MPIVSTSASPRRPVARLIMSFAVLAALAVPVGAEPAVANDSSVSASPTVSSATRFTYRAFLGGTPAGDVVVDVERDGDRYRVKGHAATTGFWRTIDDWSGDFSADGYVVDGEAVPDRYVLLEKSSRKEQHVVVSAGELFVTKNGKARTPKPAHPGIDLVSALWVVADCVDNADLHNGRHGYSVERTRLDDGTCRYDVENDDGDSYSANVRFASHGGYPVLDSLVVNRLVGTRLTLIDVEPLLVEQFSSNEPAPSVASSAAAAAVARPAASADTPTPMSAPTKSPTMPAPAGDRAADTAL